MTKLSLVIPTYNRAPLLLRLLHQILSCANPPAEIIVVDDHSTDDTASQVKKLAAGHPTIHYLSNRGRHQRDAKITGLQPATGTYLSFWEDDLYLADHDFFTKLYPQLSPTAVIQARIILENMGQQPRQKSYWTDRFASRPYPILELPLPHYHAGTSPRLIYPLIESGNFWHRRHASLFIDKNLIGDAYGESYGSSLRLYRAGVRLLLTPDLVIRHPGSSTGGSHRFQKQNMLHGFTPFHYSYFYNMIYLHSRWLPWWIWLWLPYFTAKAISALIWNHDFPGYYRYCLTAITKSLWFNFLLRRYAA